VDGRRAGAVSRRSTKCVSVAYRSRSPAAIVAGDPFHAYGDHVMVDTFRQAVQILHLDHPFADAAAMAGPVPQAITSISGLQSVFFGVHGSPGHRADWREAWALFG
jgi:hypothetical protein